MVNQDSFTPQEYAKMVGMFPDPPQNPLPTGGYMDAGFDWVVHQAEGDDDDNYEKLLEQIEEKQEEIRYHEQMLDVAGYGRTELMELEALKEELADLESLAFGAEGEQKFIILYSLTDVNKGKVVERGEYPVTASNEREAIRGEIRRWKEAGLNDDEFDVQIKPLEAKRGINVPLQKHKGGYENFHYNCPYCKEELTIMGDGWESIVAVCENGNKGCHGLKIPRQYLENYLLYDWHINEGKSAETFEARGNMNVPLQKRGDYHYNCPYCKERLTIMGDGRGSSVAICENENKRCHGLEIPRQYLENFEEWNWYHNERKSAETFGAEAQPVSDEGEFLVIRNDMGKTKGFIEMEEDLEDDSIEMEISDDEMKEIAEITLDAETTMTVEHKDGHRYSETDPVHGERGEIIGHVSEITEEKDTPYQKIYDTDFVKPSRDWFSLALGTAAVVIGGSLFLQNRGVFKADGDGTETAPSLVSHPSTGDLLPADYEEMVVESTGYAVPVIPVSLDPSFMGSRFHALPTDRVVESNEPGIGAHTDVAMTRDTNYREPEQTMVTEPPFAYKFNAENGCKCSLLDRIKSFFTGKSCCEVKEANSITGQTPYFGVGFEPKNPQTRVIKETRPISLDPSTAPYLPTNLSGYTGQSYTPPSVYSDMMQIGVTGQTPSFVSSQSSIGENRAGSRPVATSDSLQSVHGNLSAGVNQSYTDGSKTMSLSQWSIEYDVSQISDSEAFAVSRSSGERTMIRRV